MFKRAVHPGEVLKDELEELGVTPTAFARQINVPPNRVGQIIAGKSPYENYLNRSTIRTWLKVNR